MVYMYKRRDRGGEGGGGRGGRGREGREWSCGFGGVAVRGSVVHRN